MNELKIIKPDDFHIHFRDNEFLNAVVPETSKYFARGIIMPNLVPPVLNHKDAKNYKNRIKQAIPKNHEFDPLMTLYLTDNTTKEELKKSYLDNNVFAAKLYPAGATTNSDSGVTNIDKIMNLLDTMAEIGMPLLIHGETTHIEVDIFDREKVFIDNTLDNICRSFPELKITLEHITTKEATNYILEGNSNLAASVTPHHLALNRNSIFLGGIRPHLYCLPILKREKHRQALLDAVTSDNNEKFFLGTDTAPHFINDKENSCGCAGIFNATYCLPIITQIFDNLNALSNLEKFISLNGARHYEIDKNKSKIILKKNSKPLTLKNSLKVGGSEVIIFQPNFLVYWDVMI